MNASRAVFIISLILRYSIHIPSGMLLQQYFAFVNYAQWQFMFLQEYSYDNNCSCDCFMFILAIAVAEWSKAGVPISIKTRAI
jgi:hypothetical protein